MMVKADVRFCLRAKVGRNILSECVFCEAYKQNTFSPCFHLCCYRYAYLRNAGSRMKKDLKKRNLRKSILKHCKEFNYRTFLCVNEDAGLEIWHQTGIGSWYIERSLIGIDTEWIVGLPEYYQREIIEEWK